MTDFTNINEMPEQDEVLERIAVIRRRDGYSMSFHAHGSSGRPGPAEFHLYGPAAIAANWLYQNNDAAVAALDRHRAGDDALREENARLRAVVDALAVLMPIRVHDGRDYAEVFFADGATHSTQAMTMNPQHWRDLTDAYARAIDPDPATLLKDADHGA